MTSTHHTTQHTTNHTTAPGRTSRPRRHRTRRTLVGIVGPMSLLLAVGCGVDPSAHDAPAPLAQPATDSAEQHRLRWIGTSSGSDRHFAVIGEQVAEARASAVEGSDRHFGVIAERVTEVRIRNTAGSDRHLELLAAELASDRG